MQNKTTRELYVKMHGERERERESERERDRDTEIEQNDQIAFTFSFERSNRSFCDIDSSVSSAA